MLEVAAALGFALVGSYAAMPWLDRWSPDLDPAERLGLAGLLSLGLLGTVTLLLGLVPGGLKLALIGWPLILVLVSLNTARRDGLRGLKFSWPRGWSAAGLVSCSVLALIPLVAILAPSDTRDWDTLAYHLAVPKLWLQAGQVGYVPGIHHSNFPFVAELAALHGLAWGGQTGAKAFSLAWLLFGAFFVFGHARRRSSSGAAWVATLALFSIPVVLWESGTAYIDVAHGLFASVAIVFAAEWLLDGRADRSWLAGAGLGLAMSTKHTGIQVALALGLACTVVTLRARIPVRQWAAPLVASLLLATPWWMKSWVMTGNPVYPFLFEVFDGREWDVWRAAIYREEQKSFGVGTGILGLGHAVFGLSYQPGRYVNPGQHLGLGFPTGAIGMVPLLAAAIGVTVGRLNGRAKFVLAVCGLLLGLWFLLSQQSRYLTIVAIPLILASVEMNQSGNARRVWQVIVVAQAAITATVLVLFQTLGQLQVASGAISREDYQARTVGFFVPSQAINRLDGAVKVALYDEVFGFFLDKPYFWANPGHSTRIPYERLESGVAYADSMLELGFSHVYINLDPSMIDRGFRDRWLEASGLAVGAPYSDQERQEMRQDLNLWWRYLTADAVRSGRLVMVEPFGRGPRSLLFRFAR
ncbi:MAG: hypothetical protein KF884_06855 [Fimbriimonadaceae bacterium]|nr:hypothetical protein [Fimbriimonadaceae bacterium]QYK57268.1 MAG: hypothetical protein KF884_06855 [Fimbriimonadaceae bacterium]